MKTPFFAGVSTALITPFKNGEIDFNSLKRLINSQLQAGIQGFVVSGSTAEAATLSLQEKKSLLDFVLAEVSGQVPVIFGNGTNNTKETVEITKLFDSTNISGFLSVTPYYNKPPQRGLVAHFKAVAGATQKPIVLYNVPGRTALVMQVDTVKELSKIPNIVGIKEAAGDLKVIGQMVKKLPKGFSILSGDDETFVQAMGKKAHGVISVISHVVPELCLKATKKDVPRIQKISKLVFIESNPIPVKWILQEQGIIDSCEVRLPLVELDPKLRKKMKTDLKKLGVL